MVRGPGDRSRTRRLRTRSTHQDFVSQHVRPVRLLSRPGTRTRPRSSRAAWTTSRAVDSTLRSPTRWFRLLLRACGHAAVGRGAERYIDHALTGARLVGDSLCGAGVLRGASSYVGASRQAPLSTLDRGARLRDALPSIRGEVLACSGALSLRRSDGLMKLCACERSPRNDRRRRAGRSLCCARRGASHCSVVTDALQTRSRRSKSTAFDSGALDLLVMTYRASPELLGSSCARSQRSTIRLTSLIARR